MTRFVLSALVILTVLGIAQPPALAGGSRDVGHGSEVTVSDPALVEGTVWADSRGAYLVATRQWQCWYPQEWYDDVVVFGDLGEVTGYNTDSVYYDYVATKLGADPNLFGNVDLWTGSSCIQDAYLARGDCSTDERIGVLSTHAVRDANLGDILLEGDFDHHDRSGLYCLVVIERDPWLELVRDESLVPEPTRATFPQSKTLVGLVNKVWYEVAGGNDPTNDGFSIALATSGSPYSLTLQIWLTEILVDIDSDGTWDFAKQCPDTDPDLLRLCAGSLDDPVYTFEYESRAFHSFTIQTRWGGQAVDANGIALDIDPNLLSNEYTFDWETVEVRSSLDG